MKLGSRRWKSRRVKRKGWKRLFLISLLLIAFSSMQAFLFIEKNLRSPLMAVAKMRVTQIATEALNAAISDQISDGTDFDKLIDWKTDRSGKITGFMLNYLEHMKITAETKDVVQDILMDLKKRPEHIPLGQAFNSAIFASFGPDIPFRFVPAGAVKVNLNTRQQNAGINMILVEVYIRIMAQVMIIIPFDSQPETVEMELPISYLLVVGDVPMYYYDNKGNPIGSNGSQAPPPSIALPEMRKATTEPETAPVQTSSATQPAAVN